MAVKASIPTGKPEVGGFVLEYAASTQGLDMGIPHDYSAVFCGTDCSADTGGLLQLVFAWLQ
ncbi:hypothetical protein D3C74_339000 [compost metagenome]